jgi:class 3 adenylate cyclase
MWFDARGTGASDWVPHREGRLLESLIDDMVAVLDAANSQQAAVLSMAGLPTGLLFAATHPERTTALVLVNVSARYRQAEDYPEGGPDAEVVSEEAFDALTSQGVLLRIEGVAPSLADDARFRRWFERALRLTTPPDDRTWRLRSALDADFRDVLGSVRVPTLVINRRDWPGAARTRFMADHIEGARYVEVPGSDTLAFVGDAGAVLDAIEEFLTGELPRPPADRVLATVLFTDVVDSTPLAAQMGDRRWRELLATHDALVRAELDRFRGREIKLTGDGVLATFDGPARAVRCACAIRDAIHALGVEVRAGVHIGEIEMRGDDIAGIAVHVGQRVASRAAAGEVLVSRTVADLIAGSDIELLDQGEHELKGVSGTWRLFSVRD